MRSIVSPLKDAPQWPGVERRKEPRSPASGEIVLTVYDPKPTVIRGQLTDRSEGGFQVLHTFDSLRSGQEVFFSHAAGRGRARVMWTRIVPGSVSSGFLLLGSS
jgi:hypothetical protein